MGTNAIPENVIRYLENTGGGGGRGIMINLIKVEVAYNSTDSTVINNSETFNF